VGRDFSFVAGGFSFVGRGFSFVKGDFSFVEGSFPFVGRGFPFVAGGFSFVGRGFPFVGRGFSFVGRGFSFVAGSFPFVEGGFPLGGGLSVVFGQLPRHAYKTAQRNPREDIFGFAPPKPPQLGAKADGKLEDSDAQEFGHPKVAQLVYGYQAPEEYNEAHNFLKKQHALSS
jgi:hypothetical protein